MSFPGARSALLALAVAGACGEAPAPAGRIAVADDAGHEVRLDSPAQRIISLIPARTDALLALGAGDRLIARTTWDDDPSLAELPSLGDALTPSVEWIAARRPDLVIAWPDIGARSSVSRLRALGVPVYASRVETLDDVRRAVRDLGRLTGLGPQADSLLRAMDAALERARVRTAGLDRPRILYLVGLDPPIAAGPGTLVAELIAAAGGVNAIAESDSPWPTLSLEAALDLDPDVLIAAVGGASEPVTADLAARPGWRSLRAVREGRVHRLDPYWFNRPGPSAGRLALELAELLHPRADGGR